MKPPKCHNFARLVQWLFRFTCSTETFFSRASASETFHARRIMKYVLRTTNPNMKVICVDALKVRAN